MIKEKGADTAGLEGGAGLQVLELKENAAVGSGVSGWLPVED